MLLFFLADCCPCRFRSWESGVLWFLCTIEDVLGCSLLCLCTLAGGGTFRCCCSVHLHCSGGTVLR
jgi:hypothetical protein